MKIKNIVNEIPCSKGLSSFYGKSKFALAAILLSSAFLSITSCKSTAPSALASCTLRTGCTSTACTSGKQFKYDSGGNRQCCAC